ncbi:TPA: hypothetical protein P7S12_004201 [Escherichia coli]|uniref:Cobalamin synthesis G N-terminal domain-containing protein n=1 Tax=Escherichia coli TaxID=562 RepID=A0AAP7TWA1_ECOLX|nr:hypothetical protein [Escherichia coli]EFL1981379.1 hypothetical protein [Escherichia coli]EHC4142072.1 hypothetical protein [Escherichia coli]EHE2559195.1 hypothetical protein [Escherichia coli]EIH4171514.1 hypothetical protein [Escherichia coli]
MSIVKPESIALFFLTPRGGQLAKQLAETLPITCFTCENLLEDGFLPCNCGFVQTVREAYTNYSVLIFIGSTDIAIQALSSQVNNKFSTPAVVVIDECGQYVINLIFSHTSRANALIYYLASILGAEQVITNVPENNERQTGVLV